MVAAVAVQSVMASAEMALVLEVVDRVMLQAIVMMVENVRMAKVTTEEVVMLLELPVVVAVLLKQGRLVQLVT